MALPAADGVVWIVTPDRSPSLWGYLWVSPVTIPALAVVALGWLAGGRVRIVAGIVEATGSFISPLLRGGNRWVGSIAAITLGHVILGRDAECLEAARLHEHVHVRQFERWGFLMPVLYLGASARCWWKGLDPYRDNPFEIAAYAVDAPRRANDGAGTASGSGIQSAE
jgi:hypothetical protein